jgi:hypothetical protein
MSENEKQLLADAVLNFDGWVVPSAEGESSSYDNEDVAGTKRFFETFLKFSSESEEAPSEAQPV